MHLSYIFNTRHFPLSYFSNINVNSTSDARFPPCFHGQLKGVAAINKKSIWFPDTNKRKQSTNYTSSGLNNQDKVKWSLVLN